MNFDLLELSSSVKYLVNIYLLELLSFVCQCMLTFHLSILVEFLLANTCYTFHLPTSFRFSHLSFQLSLLPSFQSTLSHFNFIWPIWHINLTKIQSNTLPKYQNTTYYPNMIVLRYYLNIKTSTLGLTWLVHRSKLEKKDIKWVYRF